MSYSNIFDKQIYRSAEGQIPITNSGRAYYAGVTASFDGLCPSLAGMIFWRQVNDSVVLKRRFATDISNALRKGVKHGPVASRVMLQGRALTWVFSKRSHGL